MQATVVILTKLPGHLPVKTRLWPVLGEAGAREFYVEMLHASVALARAFDTEPTLAFSPAGADARAALPGLDRCRFLPVEGNDGAMCLEHALFAAYRGRPLVALGGDAPDLPQARVEEALRALERVDAAFVPTFDGGFSCLALRRPHAGLARGFRYGSGDSLSSLETWFLSQELSSERLDPWPDVDTPEDLEAYRLRL